MSRRLGFEHRCKHREQAFAHIYCSGPCHTRQMTQEEREKYEHYHGSGIKITIASGKMSKKNKRSVQ